MQKHDFIATDKKPSLNTSENVISPPPPQILKQLWPFVKPPFASFFYLLQEDEARKIKRPTVRKHKVICAI